MVAGVGGGGESSSSPGWPLGVVVAGVGGGGELGCPGEPGWPGEPGCPGEPGWPGEPGGSLVLGEAGHIGFGLQRSQFDLDLPSVSLEDYWLLQQRVWQFQMFEYQIPYGEKEHRQQHGVH